MVQVSECELPISDIPQMITSSFEAVFGKPLKSGGTKQAAATTGPARGPRPASSVPITHLYPSPNSSNSISRGAFSRGTLLSLISERDFFLLFLEVLTIAVSLDFFGLELALRFDFLVALGLATFGLFFTLSFAVEVADLRALLAMSGLCSSRARLRFRIRADLRILKVA